MKLKAAVLALAIGSAATLSAQDPPRPRPFPGGTPPPATQTTRTQPQAANVDPATGVALYPGAQLLGKFDASPSQAFYVYGTSAAYPTVVEYYKTALKEKGRQLFQGPMPQFDIGRFRKETMTLQPGVTVKDYTWNGREGYVHVTGRQIVKYPTVIQIVPVTP